MVILPIAVLLVASNTQKETTKVDSAMLAQINYLYQRVVDLESEIIRSDTSKPVDSLSNITEKIISKTTNQPAGKMRFLIIGIIIGLLH